MPRISLCLIARDEEAMLPACLASVRAAVDEMIVVDTGSRDRTADMARELGATVVGHPWEDDFSVARNAALEASTGDWILVLDADERLVGASVIREAVATDSFDCGMLPLHSARSLSSPAQRVVTGHERRSEPVLLPRLFRRTPDLRWTGVVHEHVEDWMRAPGRRIVRVEANIAHYGGIDEVKEARGKVDRNVHLLKRRIAADPSDAHARVYLALELRQAGRIDEARAAADEAWDLLLAEEAPTDGTLASSLVPAATQRALLQLSVDDHAGALETVQTAMRNKRADRVHPNLHYLEGVACENLALHADPDDRPALLEQAANSYIHAAELEGEMFSEQQLSGASSWAAATRLGTVLLQMGRPDLAREAFEGALMVQPGAAEPRLGRAEALVDMGRPQQALAEIADLLSEGGADAWVLAAAAAEALGSPTDREIFLERAAATARDTLTGLHRLERLNRMIAA